jgi:hypothetical protein
MEAHEVHTPHASHTGHRWLDIALASAAMLVSCISLYVAVHHGQVMERLVAANSWPSVQFSASVMKGDGDFGTDSVRLDLSVSNKGIGPARLETLELWSDGTAVASVDQLGKLLKAAGAGQPLRTNVEGATVVGEILGVRDSTSFLRITAPDLQQWGLPFANVGVSLKARVCYCSVFDECFVADDRKQTSRSVRVSHCPAVEVPFQDDVSVFLRQQRAPVTSPASAPASAP